MRNPLKDCKLDSRPPKDGWCAGEYMCRCLRCQQPFFGDKRAVICADCAYESPGEQFARWVLGKVKERTAECCSSEDDDEILEVASKLGYGNVRRVKYDPEKHGECEAEPGCEIWFWGEEKQ